MSYLFSSFLYVHASYLSEDCQACMLFFTEDRESFFSLSDAKKNIVDVKLPLSTNLQFLIIYLLQRLRRHNNILESLSIALHSACPILSQVGAADIRHFLYKSRSSAQFTNANLGPPYQHDQGKFYLMDLYRHIHGRMHLPSRPLKIMCHTAEKEVLFGLVIRFQTNCKADSNSHTSTQVTSAYELYMVLEPMTTKAAVINAANAVLKVEFRTSNTQVFALSFFSFQWAKREEETHFITTSGNWQTINLSTFKTSLILNYIGVTKCDPFQS